MKVLAIDTATEQCSVAVLVGQALHTREAARGAAHGGEVLQLVAAVLAEAGLSLGGLDAIAFGRGPGAFTGLRLAASVTQGLAWSAGLPVLPVSNLQALALQALAAAPGSERALVCQDARLQEIYWAAFQSVAGWPELQGVESVGSAAQVRWPAHWGADPDMVCAGSGLAVSAGLRRRLAVGARQVFPEILPHADAIARLAAHRGLEHAVAAELALPVYLRDDVARPSLSPDCHTQPTS